MVEVKSSTAIKPYHREDVAIQAYLAKASGVEFESIALATIKKNFVYPGGDKYEGLLHETDVTEEAAVLAAEVAQWIQAAHETAASSSAPVRRVGSHCKEPFECGFMAYCSAGETPVPFPVKWIPSAKSNALVALMDRLDVDDMTQVPDELLNELQQRVKQCTVANTPHTDRAGAKAAVSTCTLPLHALDFETIAFVVPVWPGTTPYAAVPFQYSFRSLLPDGTLEHKEFLDLSGDDPARSLAKALIADCKGQDQILVYSGY
jgi:hypothetical protein